MSNSAMVMVAKIQIRREKRVLALKRLITYMELKAKKAIEDKDYERLNDLSFDLKWRGDELARHAA